MIACCTSKFGVIVKTVKQNMFLCSEVGESSTIMFYNNMGVIHHAMGKHNMACHYFQKALKEDIAITSTNKKENGNNAHLIERNHK